MDLNHNETAGRATRRILCAEDHPQMAELLAKVLSRAGHHVVCVADGHEAKIAFGKSHFDVVITDHHMPRVNGLELVAHLRAEAFAGKVVVHTSRLTPDEETAYRSFAIDAIVMKPGGILKLPELLRVTCSQAVQ